MAFAATWMALASIILSEVREELSYDIPYMWNKKKIHDTNELTKQRLTDLENKLMVAGGKG